MAARKTRLSAEQILPLLTREQQALLPYTRVSDLGSVFSVSVSETGIDSFTSNWPTSDLDGLRGVTFQFDLRGNLVDIYFANGSHERWVGFALMELSQDALAIGEARLGYAGRSAGPPRKSRASRTGRAAGRSTVTKQDRAEFSAFLRNATDAQLHAIHRKEHAANRKTYASLAAAEMRRRGLRAH